MLKLTEIYTTIQGEARYAGVPCVMVRLARCNLRCTWCDSAYTFTGGEDFYVTGVLHRVRELADDKINLVEVTGGEPLLQQDCISLLHSLNEYGYTTCIETSGAVSIRHVPLGTHIVMDLKAPGSGEEKRNLYENLSLLKLTDEVKIVLKDREDYLWAKKWSAACRHLLLSPVHGVLDPKDLCQWMIEDGIRAKLNIQLHKYIWPGEDKGR